MTAPGSAHLAQNHRSRRCWYTSRWCILLVLDVAERRICGEVPTALAFHFERGFDLLGGVPSVKFITEIADRGHIKFRLYRRVHVVVDGDEPHIVLHKYDVRRGAFP